MARRDYLLKNGSRRIFVKTIFVGDSFIAVEAPNKKSGYQKFSVFPGKWRTEEEAQIALDRYAADHHLLEARPLC